MYQTFFYEWETGKNWHKSESVNLVERTLTSEKDNDMIRPDVSGRFAYTVATPNFGSSYRLQPVVNDSDLLSGRDFAR